MNYLARKINGLDIVVRDLEAADIPAIVGYWHRSDPKVLESIGVDLTKIVSEEETASIFRRSLEKTCRPGDRVTLVITHDDRVVGYTNLNFVAKAEAYVHVHIIDPRYRCKGLVSVLFPHAARLFFDLFGVRTLKFQTSASNARINALLRRQGLSDPRSVYIEKPDGMAKAGSFFEYEIRAESLAGLASRVSRLAASEDG